MSQQDPSRAKTLDAAQTDHAHADHAHADRAGTTISQLEAQREDHLQRLREREPAAELERLRGALEELEVENLELLKDRQRSQERVVDLERSLELARQTIDAAEAGTDRAGAVIVAMKSSVSWRLTLPLRALATVARRLLHQRPPGTL